jgi:hypothetical protein
MLSGDPRKWSTPQKEHAEGRTRPACTHDARLGLERIERLFAQRAGPMMPVQAETLSSWLRHLRRKGARYLEFSREILVAVLAEGRRGDRCRRVGEFDRLR